MNPSNSRKRPIPNYVANEAHSGEQTSPPKKRYTPTAHLIQLSPPKSNLPTACSLVSLTRSRGAIKKILPDNSTATTIALSSGYISRDNLSRLNDCNPPDSSSKAKDSFSVLKYPTIPGTLRETTSPDSISIASALNYPTKLIPLTPEERKLYTIQQLIAEKLRMMRRDNLVLLKSPRPNPHESEICLTVVEVTNNEDSTPSEGITPENYAILKDDTDDSSELFKVLLEKINKKSLQSKANESGLPSPISPSKLLLMKKDNVEYAKQIEKEVINKIISLRKSNTDQGWYSGPVRDKHALYVVFVDEDDVKEEEPPKPPTEYISDNHRREQEFTEIFDTIFKKITKEPKESKVRNASKPSAERTPKTRKTRGVEWQKEDEARRNKTIQTRDQRRRALKFYPCSTLSDLDTVTIGPNGTKVFAESFLRIGWWSWPTGYCTRKILPHIFSNETLATHSLWGTNTENRTLCSDKIDDLVYLVSDNKPEATLKDIHQAVMGKCYALKRQLAQKGQLRQNTEAEEAALENCYESCTTG